MCVWSVYSAHAAEICKGLHLYKESRQIKEQSESWEDERLLCSLSFCHSLSQTLTLHGWDRLGKATQSAIIQSFSVHRPFDSLLSFLASLLYAPPSIHTVIFIQLPNSLFPCPRSVLPSSTPFSVMSSESIPPYLSGCPPSLLSPFLTSLHVALHSSHHSLASMSSLHVQCHQKMPLNA